MKRRRNNARKATGKKAAKKPRWGKRVALQRRGVKIVVEFLLVLRYAQQYDDCCALAPPGFKPPRPAFYTPELENLGCKLKAWRRWSRQSRERKLTALILNWFLTETKNNTEERREFQTRRKYNPKHSNTFCKCRDFTCGCCKDRIRRTIARGVHALVSSPGEFECHPPRRHGRPREGGWPFQPSAFNMIVPTPLPFRLP